MNSNLTSKAILFSMLNLCLFATCAMGQQLELQSANPGFWRVSPLKLPGLSAKWRSSHGTPSDVINGNGRAELRGAENGNFQLVPINGNSKYHVILADGFKQVVDGDGWSGFGVNYYDQSWQFIDSFDKPFSKGVVGPDDDVEAACHRHSLGCQIPKNAFFAILWIWNESKQTVTFADNVGLYNYFPEGLFSVDPHAPPRSRVEWVDDQYRNLIANGDLDFWSSVDLGFEKLHRFEPNAADELFLALPGDTFWQSSNSNSDAVVSQPSESVLVIGKNLEETVLWQPIELQVGKQYSFRTLAYRETENGSQVSDQETLPGNVGVEFFDEHGNKISEVELPADGPRLSSFVVPEGTSNSLVWVWSPAHAKEATSLFHLREIEIKLAEESDLSPHVYLLDSPPPITQKGSEPFQFNVFSQSAGPVALDSGRIKVTGPGGTALAYGVAGGDLGDGAWELQNFDPPGGSWGPEDNGSYEIRIGRNYAKSDFGVNRQTFVGRFEVNIAPTE